MCWLFWIVAVVFCLLHISFYIFFQKLVNWCFMYLWKRKMQTDCKIIKLMSQQNTLYCVFFSILLALYTGTSTQHRFHTINQHFHIYKRMFSTAFDNSVLCAIFNIKQQSNQIVRILKLSVLLKYTIVIFFKQSSKNFHSKSNIGNDKIIVQPAMIRKFGCSVREWRFP